MKFKGLNHLLAWPFMALIWLYQKGISPFLPSSCIYHPSCSHYSIGSFQRHGVFWGLLLSTKRILTCHPFSQGGMDPVPDKVSLHSLWKRNG